LRLFQDWGGGIEENDGGDEFKYDILIFCKKFCKCHNVPQNNNKKERKWKK
jgi:hypothetical protein